MFDASTEGGMRIICPSVYKVKAAKPRFRCSLLVIPKRLERLTYCLEGSCSIQLSYGTDLIAFLKALQR